MTFGKTITLTIWIFDNNVMSLLFNTLSRFVIAFLPKSKHLLNIKKAKVMGSSPITSWQIEGEKVEAATDLIFLGSKITVDSDCTMKD